jgi:hypothetical protein
MEVINPQPVQKKVLPNSGAILVLGILSLIPFCVLVGLVLGIIGLVMSKEVKQMYEKNPDAYLGYGNLNAGRILCIIGIVLGGIQLFVALLWIIGISTVIGAIGGLTGI